MNAQDQPKIVWLTKVLMTIWYITLTQTHPRNGFCKCYFWLRNQGKHINQKRRHRIYMQAELSLRIKFRKRKITRIQEPLEIPESFTYNWNMDLITPNDFVRFYE